MPRKKLIYIHRHPYHVVCRTNNREFFRIPLSEVWTLLVKELIKLQQENGLLVHSAVLMSNHYHLLVSTNVPFYLGEIMHRLQNTLSREINRQTQRINHTFGGRYKASLISNSTYFYHATKYIYQNPLRAGLCREVKDWPFSNFNCFLKRENGFLFRAPDSQFDFRDSMENEKELIRDFNQLYSLEQYESIAKATRKAAFKICVSRNLRRLDWL